MPEPYPDRPDHLHGIDQDRVREEVAEVAELVATGIKVDGQVLQIAASTWAIYGHTSYDGGVIVGEYSDAEEATEVLNATPHADPDHD
jgi:hypothetical protein